MLINNNFIVMIIIYHYFVNHYYETNIIIIISYYVQLFYLIDSLHLYTTTIQGHDKFYVKTVDNVLSSSSELENTFIEHNNLIHYIVVIDGNGV